MVLFFVCVLFKVANIYTNEQLLIALTLKIDRSYLALQNFSIKENVTFYLHNGLQYTFHFSVWFVHICMITESQNHSRQNVLKILFPGKSQRDGVKREVGGGIGIGNTCKSMGNSCQCMTKTTTIL